MTDKAQLIALAEGLTEAQRRMMLVERLSLRTADWRVWPALKRKGLIDTPGGSALIWTELGLALRDHLKSLSDGGQS